ncbi:MAG: hypothetical protein FWC95_02985 [Defluviitaleaceae bacterium]|nr:hypothetical protein [Defluviitaleaceae bacterium]
MNRVIYTPDEAFAKMESIDGSVIITGVFNEANESDKAMMATFLNTDAEKAEEVFNLYFHWYNIVHELCHIVAMHNNIHPTELVPVEWMVNRMAAAFWRTFGNRAVYGELREAVAKAKAGLPNPVPENMGFEDFYVDYHNMDDSTMQLYAYFQFSLVDRALKETESIYDVLDEYGLKPTKVNADISRYIPGSDPQEIIDSAIQIYRDMGVGVPSVQVLFCDNPNVHCAPK